MKAAEAERGLWLMHKYNLEEQASLDELERDMPQQSVNIPEARRHYSEAVSDIKTS